MAGIGFKLRRYTEEGTYFGLLKGFTYSAIIVAGPWLILVLSLGGMALFSQGEMGLFHVTIMYVFSFSLIFLGLSQFVVTRYLADRLYAGDLRKHVPTFVGLTLFTLIPQGIIGGVFLTTVEAPWPFRLSALVTYLVINEIWTVLLFMGVLRAYQLVVWAFLAGGLLSLVAGLGLGMIWQQTGYMSGFALGQLATLAILVWILLSEFSWEEPVDFGFLTYFRTYPTLMALGLVYYLSTWVDKFVYRASENGVLVVPSYLWAAPHYEVAHFVAQLSIVPALALFFIRVETDFFERYREFFASLAQHKSLPFIEEQKEGILRSLKEGLRSLMMVQGTVSLITVLLAPQIFRLLYLDQAHLALLRVTLMGTFFQTMLFLVVILMLYFECYREAVTACLLFLIANGFLSWAILKWAPAMTGWGFGLAGALGLTYAVTCFMRILRNLSALTFMKQAMSPAGLVQSRLVHDGGIALYHRAPPSRQQYEWHS